MAKKIILALIGLVLVIVGYAAMQPADYKITREITIHAPAAKVFPHLNNMKLAEAWGPWKEADPTAKMALAGPEAGVGAQTVWSDGKQMGTGSATITESVPNERVNIKIDYTKPMTMTQDSVYLLKESGGESTVTWTVTGKNNVMGRVMCLFMNMDAHVGGMFEKGLAKLKSNVESAS